MSEKNQSGRIGWIDLTVDDAEGLRDFYSQVAGWTSSPVEMGGYDDFCMLPPESDQPVAGICHRKGLNINVPGGWLIYITVTDLDASRARCIELGGKVLVETRSLGSTGRFCVIEDPSGAVAALFEHP